MSVLANHGPTIVRWVEPVQTVTVNVKVGLVMPVLWSATGRAFGAFADGGMLDALIQTELEAATPEQRRQLPDRQAVDGLFEEIRHLRCAPVGDVLLNGVSAVAVPIFNANAKLAAMMTALGPSGSFDSTPGGEYGACRATGCQFNQRPPRLSDTVLTKLSPDLCATGSVRPSGW